MMPIQYQSRQKNHPDLPIYIINQLLLEAAEAQNRQALQFIITNDTHKLIPYDRAILWSVKRDKVHILSISGQSTVNPFTEFYKNLNDLPTFLIDPSSLGLLTIERLRDHQEIFAEYQRKHAASIFWIPIHSKNELCMGLWIERWNVQEDVAPPLETLNLMSEYLLPGYGAIWSKYGFKPHFKKISSTKKWIWPALACALFLLLFAVHIPLRVVAHCEIVPKDPYIVTAPLQGIIEKLVVNPGDEVQKGALLFQYDPRAISQELKIAQNEVAITEAALNRALTLGPQDQTSLNDVAVLKLKLEKEKIHLGLAKNNVEHLDVKSPGDGVAIIDDPDQWEGKPVRVGEKIMTIADPLKTKVKMWIPENDNINVNASTPIIVFLNVNPEKQWKAELTYIGSEVVISNEQIPSYIAEANWIESDTQVKPGLRGTAILYGEKVSLFYYLIRKPWILLRNIFGI